MKRILVLVLLFSALPVFAGPTGTAYISQHTGHITDGTITVYGGPFTGGATGYGGIYTYNITSATGDGVGLYDFGFCIELPQSPQVGWHDVLPPAEAPLPIAYNFPMGSGKAAYLSELWGRHFDMDWVTNQTTANRQSAEAFSAAVWEIVGEAYQADATNYDVTTWDGTSNSFKASGVNTTLANSWLHSLDGTGPMTKLYALSNDAGQDFITTKVPVPGAILLTGLGTVIVGRLRRKY